MTAAVRRSPQALGALLIVIGAVGFGTLGPLARYADDAGVTSLALVTWRAGVGAVVIIGFMLLRGASGRSTGTRPWRQIPVRDRWFVAAASASNALLNLAAFVAFVRIGIALALLIFYIYPAFVALVSATWFGDRLDRTRWAALGLSLIGAVLVVAGAGSLGELDLLGMGLALVAAFCQTFYALAARHGFGSVPGPQAAAITMGGATTLYLVGALAFGQLADITVPLHHASAAVPVLLAGVFGAAIPTYCFITGIRLIGAPRATILSTLEPVVGVGLAALLFAEYPGGLQILGGALIVAAGVLLQLRPHGELSEHEAVVATDEADQAG
jgi:drug/metabolite transporter (DMT)-like permease